MQDSSCKRYYFLFLPLVIVFLMSFLKDLQAQPSAATLVSVPAAVAEHEFYSEQNISLKQIIDEVSERTVLDQNVNKPQVKYCKKYKRWSSISAGIRPPVKNIESQVFCWSGNSTYIKPFFLSHLHSFLFRLTPF